MGTMKSYLGVFSLVFIIGIGCASKNGLQTDAIRERSDKLFDELRAEEGQKKPSSTETQKDRSSRSAPSSEKPEDTVRIQTGERPEWVDGYSTLYPDSRYLTGVGYGPNRKSAEDNARAEIAKIFTSTIDSRTRSYQEYLQKGSEGTSDTEVLFSIEEITKVSTHKVLSGIRIANIYQEQEPTSTIYALAVLDREQSAKILQDRIQESDQEIQRLLDRAQQSADSLAKIKYLKQSLQKFIVREAHESEFRIVSLSGEGIPSPVLFTDIKGRLESILFRDFFIGVSVMGNRPGEIKDALVEGLNQQGFSISDDHSRINVLVKGNVVIKPLDRGSTEWKFVEWRTHFDLIDNKTGSVFGSINKNGRQGHLTLQQAENRAVGKIQKALTAEIAEEVRQYIFFQ